MLAESARIFQQVDDDELAERTQSIIQAIDANFHPVETAFRVYGKLLHRDVDKDVPKNQ